MKRILTIFAIILCSFPTAFAAKEESAVSVRAIAPSAPVQAGETAILTIELTIARPYHINSNRPLQDYLIPTSVEFEPLDDVTFGEAIFPEAREKKLPVSDKPMSVYEGVVRITAEMRPSASFARNKIVAQGKVHSQACDDNSCLPPVSQIFKVSVPVMPARVTNDAPAPKKALDDVPASDFDGRSILLNLLLAFLGGLALNLTPCVYPILPITLAWFGGQSRKRKGNLLAHSLIYVFGMAITYSILGVIAAMTGSLFGAALRYPPVLICVAVIMALLALGMFDVYELRMPMFLNRLAGSSRAGTAGTLFMGLTAGIVAAPCIGPFVLGLLTYVGEKGSVLLGFLLFFALALGMGAPFLVLGIFSGSINKLPRSGAWMIWVRKVFGFVLLGMAAYFLRSLLSPLGYTLTLALILLLGGIYLAWIAPVPGMGKTFGVLRNLMGCLFFAAALYTAATGVQNVLEKYAALNDAAGRNGIHWENYSKDGFERILQEKKPIFIDFYADWCVPCREMDEKTFSEPEVIRRSRRFVMLKVDLTAEGDPATEAIKERYRVRGVPTFVFLRPDGVEMSSLRGTGFETAPVFLDKMDQALQEPDPAPRNLQ